MDTSFLKRSTRSAVQSSSSSICSTQSDLDTQPPSTPGSNSSSSLASCSLSSWSQGSASTTSSTFSAASGLDRRSTRTSSFFRLLIDEANAMPIHDFQLSPSFLKRARSNTGLSNRADVDSATNAGSNTSAMNTVSGVTGAGTTFEIVQSPTSSLSQFIVLDRNDFLTSTQAKQSDDFKSRVKLERTNFIAAGLNASQSSMPKLRPIEKVYLGDNFYKYNDGLIELKCGQTSIDAYLDRARKRMGSLKSTGTPKMNANSLLRRNLRASKSKSESDSIASADESKLPKIKSLQQKQNLPLQPRHTPLQQPPPPLLSAIGEVRSHHSTPPPPPLESIRANANIQTRRTDIKQRYMIEASDDDNESETNPLSKEDSGETETRFASLKAAHSDRIVKLYALPADSNPGQSSIETQILILVQHHFVNIWFQMDAKSNWKSCVLSAKKEEKIFTTELVRFPGVICLFCLATDMQSVYLKYCKIDLETQNASFLSIESFRNIGINQFDFINLGQVTADKIAISIPNADGNKVDLYVYHLMVEQRNLKNLKKSLLHTFDLSSQCRNNCLFQINELTDRFVCILDQNLYIWDVSPGMYSHQTISLEKYVSPSIIFFDAFYDRGMLYLFSGNKYTSQVKVLAVNVQRGQIAKLSSYDLDQNEAMIRDQHELEEDQETKNKPFSATTLANETKLFKRKDDQLILIKRDASLIVHNLIDNEIVFNKQLRSLHDAAIGCLNGDAVIFAACGRQSIINLLN